MTMTLRGYRRLQAVLKRRSKEAKPCPDACIVLPPGFGFRPGDWFKARYVNGSLVVTNTRKLTAKERRACVGELTSQIGNANWSSRLLPCPMCGSRATVWPDVPEGQPPGFRSYEVRCCGCGVRTAPMQYRKAEEVVAAWNWRVRLQAKAEHPTPAPTKAVKVAKLKKPKTSFRAAAKRGNPQRAIKLLDRLDEQDRAKGIAGTGP